MADVPSARSILRRTSAAADETAIVAAIASVLVRRYGQAGQAQRRGPRPPSHLTGGTNVKPIGVREPSPSIRYRQAAARQGQLMAGSVGTLAG